MDSVFFKIGKENGIFLQTWKYAENLQIPDARFMVDCVRFQLTFKWEFVARGWNYVACKDFAIIQCTMVEFGGTEQTLWFDSN